MGSKRQMFDRRVGIGQPELIPTVCPACREATVWALDDRYPHKGNVGRTFAVAPDKEPGPTSCFVLWYAVDRHGLPCDSHQWFREIDPREDYQGARWSQHLCWRATSVSPSTVDESPKPDGGK